MTALATKSDECHLATDTDEAGNKSTELTEVNTSKQFEYKMEQFQVNCLS